MHLSVERSPSLGRTVTVPALRCDGYEIMVELTVHPYRNPDGRTLFIGELVATA